MNQNEQPHNTKEFLESINNFLNATSCTFYLRDPLWSDELRLIAMPGVRFTEPMHGFSFPADSKEMLWGSDNETFNQDAATVERPEIGTEFPLDRISPEKKRHLFGNFVEREGVHSSARMIHRTEDYVEAVLFVNYNAETEFDEELKDKIRSSFTDLVAQLPKLYAELDALEAENVNQIVQLFSPTYASSKNIIYEWDQPLEEYLHSLLIKITETIPELKDGKGFGTMHLYDPETHMLRMIARSDNIGTGEIFPPLSVGKGEGIVSWVAIRRQPLLIKDLRTSDFREIYSSVKDGVKSEIAIPIIAGDDLLGVLNLESFQTEAFHPIYAKSLWFAVSQAAVAYKLARQADVNTRLKSLSDGLLKLCEDCVSKNTGDFTLDELAKLATEYLNAFRCDIWRCSPDEFTPVGISHSDFQPDAPRSSGGMSSYIQKYKRAVWLTEIRNETDFSAYRWSKSGWTAKQAEDDFPRSLNTGVIENDVKAILGIPIMVRGKCSGVAWLEYRHNKAVPPGDELMKLANGFAAHAGLVIEFSRVDLVDKDAVQEIGRTLSENLLAEGGVEFEGFPRIKGYIKSKPYSSSSIGGDFYAARVIDEQTACVLLGDGEGHAVKGALHMLPMLTVFETFWKESRSATHIMDKITNISNKLGVKGTAFYCVFSTINNRLWLSATSAGHVPIVIFQKSGMEILPVENSPADGPMFGHPLRLPLGEVQRELFSGDLIVLSTDGLDLTPEEVGSVGLVSKRKMLPDIAEALFKEALHKRAPEPFDDDVTTIIIRVI